MTIKLRDEKLAGLVSLVVLMCIALKISKSSSTSSAKTSVHRTDEDKENTSVNETLLGHMDDNNNNDNNETTEYDHWSPRKKGTFWCFLILINCLILWMLLGRPVCLLLKQKQHLQLQDGLKAFMNNGTTTTTTAWSHPVIPPIHPHHWATVQYFTETSPDGTTVWYRRDINAPCQFGILIFTVGPAKSDLPYTYELYNHSYAYYDHHGLCIFSPTYIASQTSEIPFQNPYDPSQVLIEHLDRGDMHTISSRVYDPFRSNKTWSQATVGDYAIIGITDFYNPDFYKTLESDIHRWT